MEMFAVKNDKGEWLGWEVYQDDPEFICGGGSVWTDLDKAKFYAKANGGHVVKLVEAPAKVVVSQEEADMLEKAKHNPTLRPSFMITEYSNSHKGYILGNDLEDRLMCAYVNGYTVAKEKKYNVKMPQSVGEELDVEGPKVKLPQDVGKELDEWIFDNKDRLVGRIGDLICDIMTGEPELINVIDFVDDSEENFFKIIDAYRYGWEAEKETLYNVKVPLVQAQGGLWFLINASGKLDATYIQDLAKKFSGKEINTWGLQDCEREEVTEDDD